MRILAVFFGLYVAQVFAADTPQELDAAILKERLKKIYGEFMVKTAGDWQVSYQGKVNLWKWNGKSWSCPTDSAIKCSDWVPIGFQWWSTKGFLTNWSPVSRLGFDFGRARTSQKVAVSAPSDPVSSPVPTPETDVFGGKKWALEVWEWKAQDGTSAKVYVSLRDQRIERVDVSDATEYFDWKEKPSGGQSLTRVVTEKNGLRVVFSKLQ